LSRANIVVIGAGFTGLSAASALVEAGVDVVVLEARDRVGGRVEALVNGLGERVDTGGQFLCEDMPEVMALAHKHGKALLEPAFEGAFLSQPPLAPGEDDRVYAASTAIRKRMKRLNPRGPAVLGLTVAQWLELQPEDDEAKAAFRAMIEGLWCLGIDRLPLWHLIDNDRRITNTESELQYFPASTMHSLAEDLARLLGARLRLSSPVTSIRVDAGGVTVTAHDTSIEARAVIVALPPTMARGIAFEPALPQSLAGALGAWESGAVVKVQLRYGRAFWREQGLSGMVAWRDPSGLFALDTSPSEDRPMLTLFLGGPAALGMRGMERQAIVDRIIAWLSGALGPQVARPLDLFLRDWTGDRWSGGAYSDLVVDMDATDAEQVLLAGTLGIVFAASELSPSFPGYIEGAIIAGRAAAERALSQLGR
jgi:monoamine oxidase